MLTAGSVDWPRGRGLVLVDRLRKQWGVDMREDGKSVWAVMQCT